jgi:RNA 3'-terminal phosphate cyclase (ATP)
MKRMIELDGSQGEGGGQILRTSLSLALLMGKPFRLRNLRARRPKPGLQPQHLTCVRAATSISRARVRGDSLGSKELVFDPGEVIPGAYHFNIGTAGATSLVLHTLYLPLAWKAAIPSALTLRGGTHVPASPCYEFLQHTWRPYLDLLGVKAGLSLFQPGFYPRGGGVMEARLEPCFHLKGLQFAGTPRVSKATVLSAVAHLPEHIAERLAQRTAAGLEKLGLEVEVQLEKWSNGPAAVVEAFLNTSPVPSLLFALGKRGRPAERVADELVEQTSEFLQGQPGVDTHSADQLLLPLALANGPSTFRVTQVSTHLLTNMSVIQQFVERSIECDGREGEPGVVRVT